MTEIREIHFQVASTEDIRAKSVYVASVHKYSDNKRNTVYDPRSGALFNQRCETCKEFELKCPGHFGHIELAVPIVHPLFLKDVVNTLKLVCHKCCRLIVTKDHMQMNNLLHYEGEKRITEMVKKLKKYSKCFHCGTIKRDYKVRKDVSNVIQCTEGDEYVDMPDSDIKAILDDIDSESLKLLKSSHPKDYVLEVFPVIPPCCRPYDFVGNQIREDDLTKQLVDIISANNSIATSQDPVRAVRTLKMKIEGFCRPLKKKSKSINMEPIKSIRDRLTGKDGQLRDNLMGKRNEMSARTVIGPGPNLRLDEVGIPDAIAQNIVYPMNVYEANMDEILEMIESGLVQKLKRDGRVIHIDVQRYSDIMKVLRIKDVVLRRDQSIVIKDNKFILQPGDRIMRDGVDVTPPVLPSLLPVDLRVGDVAQRRIIDGDMVLINRQPTLHKQSMIALKAKVTRVPMSDINKDYGDDGSISTHRSEGGEKTIRFNPALCKPFNADFDGDEANAHFPQSTESKVELQLLSTPKDCLISSSNGVPIIVLIQDGLLGAYLMSDENEMIVSKEVYNDIIMTLTRPVDHYLERKSQIRDTLKKLDLYKGEHSLRTGRSLLSLLMPGDLCYETEDIKIVDGVLCEGRLNKSYLGSTENSLIYIMKYQYSDEDCMDFINNIQFMTNHWLLYRSFSVSIADCYQNEFIGIDSKLEEAELVSKTILNKRVAEAKVNQILSNAKDIGMKISEGVDNNFVTTIKSGSKGDYFNLGQVKGLLGQQIINGRRVDKLVDNNTRTLIHYPREGMSVKEQYESRGFIMNSFYRGLNAKEFFFHSMSGRQGVCDTAMTTYRSGYIMRKIIKNTEDVSVQYDGTILDSSKNIYSYGELNRHSKAADRCLANKLKRVLEL